MARTSAVVESGTTNDHNGLCYLTQGGHQLRDHASVAQDPARPGCGDQGNRASPGADTTAIPASKGREV